MAKGLEMTGDECPQPMHSLFQGCTFDILKSILLGHIALRNEGNSNITPESSTIFPIQNLDHALVYLLDLLGCQIVKYLELLVCDVEVSQITEVVQAVCYEVSHVVSERGHHLLHYLVFANDVVLAEGISFEIIRILATNIVLDSTACSKAHSMTQRHAQEVND